MEFHNQKWILKSRPTGIPRAENFELVEERLSTSDLGSDTILIRNLYTRCAPDQRNWMNENVNFHPPIPLGATISAPTIGRVVASNRADYPEGRLIYTWGGWTDYTVVDVGNPNIPLIAYPDTIRPLDALAVLGTSQLTAYFGLLKVGQPQPGEILVVSGAAGSVGSTAAQIGKIMGCHVIGIAGERDKVDWLKNDCELDVVIDYKSENVAARLKEICHDRINIFFDNIGGDILQAAFDSMAQYGRIVLCGQISGYSRMEDMTGPGNFMRMVHGALRMEGFLLYKWKDEIQDGLAQLKTWHDQGLIKHREDLRSGLENVPAIFPDLFTGKNKGTLVVKLAEDR